MRLFVLVSEHHCSTTLSLLFELIGPGAAIRETKQEPQDKREYERRRRHCVFTVMWEIGKLRIRWVPGDDGVWKVCKNAAIERKEGIREFQRDL